MTCRYSLFTVIVLPVKNICKPVHESGLSISPTLLQHRLVFDLLKSILKSRKMMKELRCKACKLGCSSLKIPLLKLISLCVLCMTNKVQNSITSHQVVIWKELNGGAVMIASQAYCIYEIWVTELSFWLFVIYNMVSSINFIFCNLDS